MAGWQKPCGPGKTHILQCGPGKNTCMLQLVATLHGLLLFPACQSAVAVFHLSTPLVLCMSPESSHANLLSPAPQLPMLKLAPSVTLPLSLSLSLSLSLHLLLSFSPAVLPMFSVSLSLCLVPLCLSVSVSLCLSSLWEFRQFRERAFHDNLCRQNPGRIRQTCENSVLRQQNLDFCR